MYICNAKTNFLVGMTMKAQLGKT